MQMSGSRYENYKLCDELKPREICLVVERYDQGKFTRKFHEHVPRFRLSSDARANLLRALVIRVSSLGAETIVRCHLNARGKTPPADEGNLRFVVTYPERGVLRTYCGTNTKAWFDQVIQPSEFRRDVGTTPLAV
jgi:hypothetical protein